MSNLQITLQNINIIYNRIKTIDQLLNLINEENVFVVNSGHFTDIDEYNNLMKYLKNINVSVESTLKYYNDLDKNEENVNESINYILKLLNAQNGQFNVSTNGIISEMTQLIVKVYEKKEMDTFIDHILKICKSNNSIKIFFEYNQFTVPKFHFNNKQYIKLPNGQEITFQYFMNNVPSDVNFLTWIIQTIPLLLFYVPYNLVVEKDFKKDQYTDSIKLLNAGISFYGKLSNKLKLKVDSKIDKVLYEKYTGIEQIKKLYKWYGNDTDSCLRPAIECKSGECTLSRFLTNDGFNSSTVNDYEKNNVFDALYSHKYLDSRHLSTILLGTPKNPNYRNDIKLSMLKFVNNDLKNKENDIQLQYFTRIKLVLYELSKLDLTCQTIFNNNIVNLF